MSLNSSNSFRHVVSTLACREIRVFLAASIVAIASAIPQHAVAQSVAPDVLVLSNGDTLHGKLVSSSDGKVTFHSDALGDISLSWDKVKELHTSGSYAVVDKSVKVRSKKNAGTIPTGQLEVTNNAIAVRPEKEAAPAPIPVANALYIMDTGTLDKELHHQPGFFTGWNGAATAGAAIVAATENQYTFSGGYRTGARRSYCELAHHAQSHVHGFYGLVWEDHAAGVYDSRNGNDTSDICTRGGHEVRHLSRGRRA
jgi:hypothetical protein